MHPNTNNVDAQVSDDSDSSNTMKEMLIAIPVVLFMCAVIFMVFRAFLELPWVFI